MLQIKIEEGYPIKINNFIETKDGSRGKGINSIIIELEDTDHLKEHSIDYLLRIFQYIPYLTFIEDDKELLKINKEISLYKIIKVNRKGKVLTFAQLDYMNNEDIK